jgi:hypothetical protein
MKRTQRMVLGTLLGMWCAHSAFAQAYDQALPKTRAQVKAELAQWVAAGYDPSDWLHYPENAEAAGRIVAARRAAEVRPLAPQ